MVSRIRAAHILVGTKEEAEDVLSEIESGKDFGAIAKERSKFLLRERPVSEWRSPLHPRYQPLERRLSGYDGVLLMTQTRQSRYIQIID